MLRSPSGDARRRAGGPAVVGRGWACVAVVKVACPVCGPSPCLVAVAAPGIRQVRLGLVRAWSELRSSLVVHLSTSFRGPAVWATLPHTVCLLAFSAEMKEQVVKVPQMAESISEGTLKAWNKNVGEFVKQDEEVVSIETDKVDVAVNAPFSGIIKEVYAKEEDLVTVGADLFKLEAGEAGDATGEFPETGCFALQDQSSVRQKPSAPAPKVEAKKTEPKQEDFPAPKEHVLQNAEKAPESTAAARECLQFWWSPSDVIPRPSLMAAAPKQAAPQGFAQSMPVDYRSEQSVKMTRMRKTIASRLKESQNVAASLTTFNEVDMTNLMDLRSTYKELVLKQHGVKLGFMSAFTKAVCHALKAVP
ncbi:MAG: LOW QUALITY PROTEIN: hypothetical protein BJ554DRAFT_1483, partial [Olpidium bornovanus]